MAEKSRYVEKFYIYNDPTRGKVVKVTQCKMKDLKKGDVFRVWQHDGYPLNPKIGSDFIATSDGFVNEHGVGCVEVDDSQA